MCIFVDFLKAVHDELGDFCLNSNKYCPNIINLVRKHQFSIACWSSARMNNRELQRLAGGYFGRKIGWRCSVTRSAKSKLDRHQKIKFKIKFNLDITDS